MRDWPSLQGSPCGAAPGSRWQLRARAPSTESPSWGILTACWVRHTLVCAGSSCASRALPGQTGSVCTRIQAAWPCVAGTVEPGAGLALRGCVLLCVTEEATVWGRWQGRGPCLFSWRGRLGPEHEQGLVWLLTAKSWMQASTLWGLNLHRTHT